MVDKELLERITNDIIQDKLIQKYLCRYGWISGSSTMVYPIMVWKHDIVLQVTTDRNVFKGFIDRIMKKYNNVLEWGCFWKSDGSCPSTITFQLKEIEKNGL